MKYQNLIKQLNVYKSFTNEFMSGKLSQAYLFVSEDGLTNSLLLENLAQFLVCVIHDGCNSCAHCAKSNAGTHPDILKYPIGNSFSVQDAADIYDKVQVKPMLANYKIFIINGIDNSTEQAQNKMLKIIEEPPKNVIFLISANNENKVLKTILSRVQKKYIEKTNKNVLLDYIELIPEIKEIAINCGDGYLGKTIDISQNEQFINNYQNIKKLILNLKNSAQIPNFSLFLTENKAIFESSLIILNDFFRDLLMIKTDNINLVKNVNLIEDFSSIAGDYSAEALVEILKRINLAKRKLDSNVNLTLIADILLLEILEVKFLCK